MSAETEEKTEKKTSAENQEPQTYQNVERGIYRYKDSKGKITYHERPWIEGKRKWRSLGFAFTPQSSLKLARKEYHRRRGQESVGQDPYAEKLPPAPAPAPAPSPSQNADELHQITCWMMGNSLWPTLA